MLVSLRERNPLPAGTSPIVVGLAINGLATYGFLVVARRSLGDEAYGGLAVLWGFVYILGPGIFQPLEQEVARATAGRMSRGEGSAPVLRQASRVGAMAMTVLTVGILAWWPFGLAGLLDHRIDLLVALLASLAAFGVAELVRGILSGRHKFREYGRYFAVEGISRFVLAFGFGIIGFQVVGVFGFSLAAAFGIGALVAYRSVKPFVNPGPPAALHELTPALGLLLVTSIGEAFLLNVGPVALSIVGDELGDEAPGVFLNGLIISRVPLFFFQAVKASLLPSLATLAGNEDLRGFRDLQLRLVAGVAAVAGSSMVLGGLIGPWIVEAAFGDVIGARSMALLAGSGGGLMVMLSLSLGLVALDHTRLAVVGFVVAIVVFPIAMQFPDDAFLQVEVGLLAAVVAGSLATAVLLRYEYAMHTAAGRLSK
ncbi:MAG: hypothetical protein HOH36_06545 [Acidimicrobiaceae bacterium]|nr:hypothetical protein [Acidimicrobiaceae bacterium]MBT5582008.1 hypothetical protein [Acidimicrobiaceae bacterium]MBT5850079.1 hypothetical protein [Acidimicrobiaceae bacterium]